MKRTLTFLWVTLLCCIGMVKADVTDLPQITTDLENPIYYTIYNTRSSQPGGLMYYAGDAVGLKDGCSSLGNEYKFFFTGSHDALYIHNAATTNKLASVNSWTAEGTEWAVGVSPMGNGLAIGPKGGLDGNGCINEKNYGTGADQSDFTTWSANDEGSIFVMELADSYVFPMTDMFYVIECPLFEKAQGVKKALYVNADGAAAWATEDLSNHNFYWVPTVNEDGTVALKNLGTNKYLSNTDGVMADEAVYATINALGAKSFNIKFGGNALHANGHGGGNGASGGLTSWGGAAGSASAWQFVQREDPTKLQEAVVTYNFTYGDEVKYTQKVTTLVGEAWPAIDVVFPYTVSAAAKPEGVIAAEDLTDGAVTKEIALTIGELPFVAAADVESIDTWYYVKMHSNTPKYIQYLTDQTYLEWVDAEKDETAKDTYAWAFVGNIFDGFKVVNKAAAKAMQSTADGAVVLVDYADASLYVLAATRETSEAAKSGFCLRRPDANKECLNASAGKVAHWWDNDAGSTFMLEVVENEPEVEDPTPDPEETIDMDLTHLVGTSKAAWEGNNGGPVTIDGISLPEKYETTTATLGDVMWQTVTGLENGKYTVELWANARYTSGRGFNSDAADGALDFTYLYANNVEISIEVYHNGELNSGKSYKLEGVEVTDGTLKMGMTKKAAGSNWHTIQIKSLTLHATKEVVVNIAKADLKVALDAANAVSPATEALATAIAAAQAVYDNSNDKDEVVAATAALKTAIILANNTNAVAGASEENPVLTNFVVNGTFDSSKDPWKSTTGAQNQALASNKQGAFTGNFFENWNPNNYTGKLYQVIENIPNGVYELSIAAFVETFDASAQFVYANADKVALTTGDPTAYKVRTIVKNNTIEVGFEQTAAVNRWCGIDNVSLTYLGEASNEAVVNAAKEAFTAAYEEFGVALEACQAMMLKMSFYEIDDAAYQLNEQLETTTDVDALNAMAETLAEATASLKEINEVYAGYDVFVQKFKAAAEISEPTTTEAAELLEFNMYGGAGMQASSLEALAQAVETIKADYFTYIANANLLDGNKFDLTFMIQNPGFEMNLDGWTGVKANRIGGEGYDGVGGIAEIGEWGASSWNASMSQAITNLPNGKYVVKAAWMAATGIQMTFAANAGETTVTGIGDMGGNIAKDGSVVEMGQGHRGWQYVEVEGLVEDGTLTISVSSSSAAQYMWSNADAFELYYAGVPAPAEPEYLTVVGAKVGDVALVEGMATVESISTIDIIFDRPVAKAEDAGWATLADSYGPTNLDVEVLEAEEGSSEYVVRFTVSQEFNGEFTEAGEYTLNIPEGFIVGAEGANFINAAIEAVITIEAAPATPLIVTNVTVGEDVMEGFTVVATPEDMIKINFDGQFYFQGTPVIVDAEGNDASAFFMFANGLDVDGSNSYIFQGMNAGTYTITMPKASFMNMMQWKAPAEDIVLTVQIETKPEIVDVTSQYLQNADFETPSAQNGNAINTPPGWTMTYDLGGWLDGSTRLSENPGNDASQCFNVWAGEFRNADIYQKPVLPAGKYKLTVGFYSDADAERYAYATVGGNTIKSARPQYGSWDFVSVEFSNPTEGEVTMGAVSKGWFQIDNVKLEYLGEVGKDDFVNAYNQALGEAQALVDQEMSAVAAAQLDATIAAYGSLTADNSIEELEAATDAILAELVSVKASVNSYKVLAVGALPDNSLEGWTCTNSNTFHINTWSGEGNSDGTNMVTPFIENWVGKESLLGNGKISYTLPGVDPGYYKVSSLIRVYSEANNDISGASFFANEVKTDFATGKPFTYNNMKGIYDVYTAVVNVGEEGVLEFGVEIENPTFNWVAFKNVKIEYIGVIDQAAAEVLKSKIPTTKYDAALTAEVEALVAAIDAGVTYENYLALSEKVALAEASAAAYAANKTAIDGMFTLMASTNVYTAEAFAAYSAKAEDFLAQYEAGTLTATVDNPLSIHGWHATADYCEMLLSAFGIAVDDWANLHVNTWSTEGEADGSEFKVPFYEYWTGDGESLGVATKTATITGLTPGMYYTVEAWVRVRAKNGVAATDATGITLSVGNGEAVDLTEGEVIGTSQFSHAIYKANGPADAEGTLTINFNILEGNNVSWLSFKNMKYVENPEADPSNYTSAIVNADLSTGDAWNTEGTKGISGGMVKVSSGATFDFCQTISLPAGQYKMTAKAAYRYGANEQAEYDAIKAGDETHLVKLYAETATYKYEANVQNRYEGASETNYAPEGENVSTVNSLFVPNSSNAVKAWFDADQYVNVLVFNVQEDGEIKIGIANVGNNPGGDYTNIGAWTLTRLGDAEADPVVEPEYLTVVGAKVGDVALVEGMATVESISTIDVTFDRPVALAENAGWATLADSWGPTNLDAEVLEENNCVVRFTVSQEFFGEFTEAGDYYLNIPEGFIVGAEDANYINATIEAVITIEAAPVTPLTVVNVTVGEDVMEGFTVVATTEDKIKVNFDGEFYFQGMPSIVDAEGNDASASFTFANGIDVDGSNSYIFQGMNAGTYTITMPKASFLNMMQWKAPAEDIVLTVEITFPVGIQNIEVDADAVIYDLSGRRVNVMTKGIYIVNGKKVIKK